MQRYWVYFSGVCFSDGTTDDVSISVPAINEAQAEEAAKVLAAYQGWYYEHIEKIVRHYL